MKSDDDVFSGRGSPAFMSAKEPAIRMLKGKYSESFALTSGNRENQVHLFMIKLGMWSLVWTFTPADFEGKPLPAEKQFGIDQSLRIIEDALSGKNDEMQTKLDEAVGRAQERVRSRIDQFKPR